MNPAKRIKGILGEHPDTLKEWGYANPLEVSDGLVFDVNTTLYHPGFVRVSYEDVEGAYFIRVSEEEYGFCQDVGFVSGEELFNVLDKVIREGLNEDEIESIRNRWWGIPDETP